MKKLGGFFEKFNGKIAGQIKNLIIISEVIKKHTGIEVEMKNLAISAGVLRLKISSVEKSQIYMKKEKILKEINERVRGMKIEEIG